MKYFRKHANEGRGGFMDLLVFCCCCLFYVAVAVHAWNASRAPKTARAVNLPSGFSLSMAKRQSRYGGGGVSEMLKQTHSHVGYYLRVLL